MEGTSQFNEDLIKTFMKKVMKDILLKLMFKYSEHTWPPLNELHNDLPFENWKLKKSKSL